MGAVDALLSDDPGPFLAFPLTVMLPILAFGFLAVQRRMKSAEGALMQLGALLHLLLIMAFPGFALYLALGFPVVFLVVELSETRCPPLLQTPVKQLVLG